MSIGMRRAGFMRRSANDIKRAFDLLYRSGLNLSQALEKAQSANFGPLGQEFFDFVREAKKRGICPYRGKKDREEAAAKSSAGEAPTSTTL